MIPWLAVAALAQEPALTAEAHGNVKSFFLATFPYENELFMPDGPYGQGIASARVQLTAKAIEHFTLEIHPALTAQSATESAVGDTIGTGVGQSAPEAVDLTWIEDDGTLRMIGRIDWMYLRTSYPGIDVTLGRQPVGFGNGLFFTPMDLVNPFSVTTIDTEFRAGVDAVRVDGFLGMSRISAVAAYAGDWTLDETVLAIHGQGTIGVTDVSGFLGSVYAEPVFGLGAVTSIGPVGVHTDTTLTLPEDDDPFVRSVVGVTWRPTATTSLSTEAYLQTFGASSPDGYLLVASSDRFTRGEVWQMGRTYAALSLGQEITPLILGNLALIGNLADPSAMLAPSLTWSLAENADLSAGVYAGLGARPEEVDPLDLVNPATLQPWGPKKLSSRLGIQSEFGLVPTTAFLQMRAYF